MAVHFFFFYIHLCKRFLNISRHNKVMSWPMYFFNFIVQRYDHVARIESRCQFKAWHGLASSFSFLSFPWAKTWENEKERKLSPVIPLHFQPTWHNRAWIEQHISSAWVSGWLSSTQSNKENAITADCVQCMLLQNTMSAHSQWLIL